MKNRLLSLLILFVVFTSMSLYAGGDSEPEETTSQRSESGTEGYTLPIVEPGSYTLTYLGRETYHPNTSFKDSLPIWEEFEKRTGVIVDWQVFPGNQIATIVQTRLAAAQDLPDVIEISPIAMGDAVRFGQDGVILKLNDALDRYAPNIKRMFAEIPDIGGGHVSPDGGIYWLAGYLAEPTNGTSFTIRKDWLDKLGLPMPTTADDWYTTLKAFKENDLNNTGKNDIIPFGGTLEHFGSAFGLISPVDSNSYIWYDENSKAYCTATTPNYKEYLKFAKRLYEEELIDPMYGAGQSMVGELLKQNKVGSKIGYPGTADNDDNVLKNLGVADVDNRYIFPPENADGRIRLYTHSMLWGPRFAVSKDVKDISVVMKYLDYHYADPDGMRLRLCGIEGEDYYIDDNGILRFLDSAMNNPDMNIILWLRSRGAFESFLGGHSSELNNARFTGKFKEGMELIASDGGMHAQRWPVIIPTPDEQRSIQMIGTDIETYITESSVAFITGREPIDNFDKFVSTLNGMGLADLLSIYQKQFDRYIAAN